MGDGVSELQKFVSREVTLEANHMILHRSSGSASGSGQAGSANANTKMQKKKVSSAPLSKALEASPFKGLTKNQTKETVPGVAMGVHSQSATGRRVRPGGQ